jgi:hypothetical protein
MKVILTRSFKPNDEQQDDIHPYPFGRGMMIEFAICFWVERSAAGRPSSCQTRR